MPENDASPFVPELVAAFPAGTWHYQFFVNDWHECISIAGRDAAVEWVGEKPKHLTQE